MAAPAPWVAALLSGGIAMSSCVINDYHDLEVDRVNAPGKPLASGAVTTDAALLLAAGLYCGVLIVACFMVGGTRARARACVFVFARVCFEPLRRVF